MKLTVLLPVYNAGRYLGQAIQSILDQDDGDFEFLIIDDLSTDRSADVIAGYARRDPRIRAVYHRVNLGLAATLNEGIQAATGDLVVRMDQDDESLPSRLRVQRRYMIDNPGVAVAGSYVYHMGGSAGRDRLVVLPTEPEKIRTILATDNCLYHPSTILRKSDVLAVGGYRPEFKNAEDYDLWLRLSEKHQLANIPVPLLRYRFTTGGMSLSRRWEQFLYHQLAIAAHANRDRPLDQVMEIAVRQRDRHDREKFLSHVYSATLAEHVALSDWGSAGRLAWKIVRELGVGPGLPALKSAVATARRQRG